MKKIVFALLFISIFQTLPAQADPIPEKPVVDKRVELMSIVFRLAGKKEYSSEVFKLYISRIEEHFGNYRDHDLIHYIQSVMYEKGLSYDAVMSMAVHLDNNLHLKNDIESNSLDKRWGEECAEKFTILLRKFNDDSGFDQFFKENSDIYMVIEKRFQNIFGQIDFDWFESFYGEKSPEKYIIYNGLGNGPNNYGNTVQYKNSDKEAYSIMGTWIFDDTGMPVFNKEDYFTTIIHEFSHSFVNQLNAKHVNLFKESLPQIFSLVEYEMRLNAYNDWKIMLDESLVRASVIKYMKDHNFSPEEIEKEINTQFTCGFYWIRDLVNELDKYSSQRDKYSNLESYLPRISEAYKYYLGIGNGIDMVKPRVTSISEFQNGENDVDPALSTITFNFDRPMASGYCSIYYFPLRTSGFPKVKKVSFTPNYMSVKIDVILIPEQYYQFVLIGKDPVNTKGFVSSEGFGLKNYFVDFKTGKFRKKD